MFTPSSLVCHFAWLARARGGAAVRGQGRPSGVVLCCGVCAMLGPWLASPTAAAHERTGISTTCGTRASGNYFQSTICELSRVLGECSEQSHRCQPPNSCRRSCCSCAFVFMLDGRLRRAQVEGCVCSACECLNVFERARARVCSNCGCPSIIRRLDGATAQHWCDLYGIDRRCV